MFDDFYKSCAMQDEIRPDRRTVEADKAAVLAKIRESGTGKISVRPRRGLAAAAALAAAVGLTVTAGAANDWDYGRLIRGFFPDAVTKSAEEAPAGVTTELAGTAAKLSDAAEKLNGIMQQIPAENAECTFTNYDVSFDGVICDGRALMLSAEFRKKDGSAFTKEEINSYSTFWDVGVNGRAYSASEGLSLNGDGSMRAFALLMGSNFGGEAVVDAKLSCLLKDYDGLKKPRDISVIDSEKILDGGSLSARFMADAAENVRDITLESADGSSFGLNVTPISAKFTFPAWQFSEKGVFIFHKTRLYDKNGDILLDLSTDAADGIGDETGTQDGNGFFLLVFRKPIDPSAIAFADCGGYAFGKAPEADGEPEIREESGPSGFESIMKPVTGEPSGSIEGYDVSFDGTVCAGKTLIFSVTLHKKNGGAVTFNDAGYFTPYVSAESETNIDVRSEKYKLLKDGSARFTAICEVLSEPSSAQLCLRYSPDKSVVSAVTELSPESAAREFLLTSPDGSELRARVTPAALELYRDTGKDVNWNAPEYADIGNAVIKTASGTVEQMKPIFNYTEGHVLLVADRAIDVDSVIAVEAGNFHS